LDIKLPTPPEPFGIYAEAVQTRNLLFLTGMLPTVGREAKFIGRIGAELDVKMGHMAAYLAGLNVLAVARQHLGSLDEVTETVMAVLLLIPKTARWGARLIVVWMTAVILSHIFVLGYGWFFVDALLLMLLAVIYLLLTRGQSDWGEPESVGTMAATQTRKQ
jgi:chromate transport protein ChrA